jgi:hypothetical protein
MKITICGSITHSDKIIEIMRDLELAGYEVEIPYMTKKILNGEVTSEEFKKHKAKEGDAKFREEASDDLIKRYYKLINNSDAVLVVNVDKNGIKNYIGGNVLMEIGFAHVLDKKIFFLNPIPEISYTDELKAVKPIILNGDLTKIKF